VPPYADEHAVQFRYEETGPGASNRLELHYPRILVRRGVTHVDRSATANDVNASASGVVEQIIYIPTCPNFCDRAATLMFEGYELRRSPKCDKQTLAIRIDRHREIAAVANLPILLRTKLPGEHGNGGSVGKIDEDAI
jgi:hypothetical protein